MGVISRLPAATEIVAALGAGGRLVGVTHECDYPAEVRVLARVTRSRLDPDLSSGEIDRALAAAKHEGAATVEVDVDLVGRLRPDVIIAQAICDVCAVGQEQLAGIVSSLRLTPWVVTLHAHTLVEVFVDMRKVGEAMELRDEADEMIAGLAYRLRRVWGGARPPPCPRPPGVGRRFPPLLAGGWGALVPSGAGGGGASCPSRRASLALWRSWFGLPS